jgi:A/G-specific adenine glycosylase
LKAIRVKMSDWSHKLLKWYEVNKRDLPWRGTNDPYKIWLSEVILQQTRVNQGWDYYNRFTEKYPTVSKLAAASEHDILKLWQGLGYYSRARNMHHAAKEIVAKYKGQFPTDYESIRALKGVGDYTAAAVASIAYKLPYAVVDGNVLRVYSRLLGISAPIDSTEGKKKIWEAAAELLPKNNPGNYNQAIMELGALCCTPKSPNCPECPVQSTCYAYEKKQTSKLPVKQGKTKVRDRFLNYIVISKGDSVLLRNRKGNDIWKGLNDFPCIETEKSISPDKLISGKELKAMLSTVKPVIESVSTPYKHILSHQKLNAQFIKIKIGKTLKKLPPDCSWVEKKNINKYAVPRLIERYISNYL